MYGLNRGDMGIVSGGSGIRQAGGRGSVVGKDAQAGVSGQEIRRCRSSDLWSIPQCGIRNRAVGSH